MGLFFCVVLKHLETVVLMSIKKPLIYWGKSRLVFSHNLNHDQFCNTVDIQVIVSGHVETVVLMFKQYNDKSRLKL